MEKASWTYFAILGFSLLYPLAQSFEKRVAMYRKIRYILPGIAAAGVLFIAWDILFTRIGIWGFNHNFTRDLYLAGLPLEEWLFFLVVPYCCLFLYEVLRYFVKRLSFPRLSFWIIIVLLTGFTMCIPFIYQKTYTITAVSFTSIMLLLQLLQKSYRSRFFGFIATYLLSLAPFMIVNGLLTSIPVVWYNNSENLALRIWTIPVEDFVYLLGLLLLVMNIYQLMLRRSDPML